MNAPNRIVAAYLEFAELQAGRRRPMHMKDWIAKLDNFLKLSDREILKHAGRISQQEARAKAEAEFEKYRRLTDAGQKAVDRDFEEAIKKLKPPGTT